MEYTVVSQLSMQSPPPKLHAPSSPHVVGAAFSSGLSIMSESDDYPVQSWNIPHLFTVGRSGRCNLISYRCCSELHGLQILAYNHGYVQVVDDGVSAPFERPLTHSFSSAQPVNALTSILGYIVHKPMFSTFHA